jgi:uncharacterized membrane protein YebE (DUF533 family)
VSEPTAETPTAAAAAEEPSENAELPPGSDEATVQILASKILIDWLRNRQQLLVPLALDLTKLEAPVAEMLMRAMVTAAHADGMLDPSDERRLSSALERLNASESQREGLRALASHRKSLGEVLAGVHDAETGAMVYAASLLASDRRKRVNRYYLRYLAERLKLTKDLVRGLEQRYNAGL